MSELSDLGAPYTVHVVGEVEVVVFMRGIDSGTVYDLTQTCDDIHDGAILVLTREAIVGVMMSAWPTAVTEHFGELHTYDPELLKQHQGDKYDVSIGVAKAIAAAIGEAVRA